MTKKKKQEQTTPRWDILHYLLKGYSNREISEGLNIPIGTVAYHIRELMNKYRAINRTNLAYKAGLRGIK